MKHELKIWPANYERVARGELTFQLRDNDREFQQGDTVILKEWDPTPQNATSTAPKGFTDRKPLEHLVGFVLVLDSSRVIFSLLPAKKGKT